MILKAFTIYDVKAESYMQPFWKNTTGLALREFQEAANNPDNMIGRYPTDYVIFEIGTFDDTTATMVQYEAKVPLGSAHEFVTPEGQSDLWPKEKTAERSTTDSHI
jgi:hypothetical protein